MRVFWTARKWASWQRVQKGLIGLCLSLLLALTVSYAGMLRTGNAGITKTDFVPMYSASAIVLLGQGADIYSLPAVGNYERSLVRPLQVTDGVMPFLYAPHFSLALAPLAALPFGVAYGLWLAINLVILAGSVVAIQQYAQLRGADALLLWAAALSFVPVFVALAQGQTSLLLLGIGCGALIAFRSERQLLAGVLLALALVKAPYLVPFLVVLAAQRRWRALGALAATVAALLAAPMAIEGASILPHYWSSLTSAASWKTQIGGFDAALNHSFTGFFQLLLPHLDATIAGVAFAVLALGSLAAVARQTQQIDVPFGLAVLIALLISPHVLVHDLSLLLIPVAVLLRFHCGDSCNLGAGLFLGYFALLAGLRLNSVLHIQFSFLVMIALGAWLVVACRQADQEERGMYLGPQGMQSVAV